jgi:hypothetical protein
MFKPTASLESLVKPSITGKSTPDCDETPSSPQSAGLVSVAAIWQQTIHTEMRTHLVTFSDNVYQQEPPIQPEQIQRIAENDQYPT